MSTKRKSKRQKVLSEAECFEVEEHDEHLDVLMLPNSNDSGESDCESDSDDNSINEELENLFRNECDDLPQNSYQTIRKNYTPNQSKLEPDHIFEWVDGEKKYDPQYKNETFISDSVAKKIRSSSSTELFEYFFSMELKEFILEATCKNDCQISMTELDKFLGIIILSIFNQRKSQRDYWSQNHLLACDAVARAMSRNKFEDIKSKLKLSKPGDENSDDRAWRVRGPLEIFKKNVRQFGYFSSALSVDEMMVKFRGRTILKQFIRNKPVRFGIKMWALCSSEGFLFDCDIYCGKNSKSFFFGNEEKLNKCALGSCVVVGLLQNLLSSVVPRNVVKYHVYFDNFFTSPDLLVHLKKVGLRATGTVRANRIQVKNPISEKDPRGTFIAKHDKCSGVNYVTVKDSKVVSVLSTLAGVTPMSSVKRYSSEAKSKVNIAFPNAFKTYNKFMGGVDLHDAHCSNLMPCIRSKKWTWVVLMRLVQASITNATVLRNLVVLEKKIGTKDMAMQIAESYLKKSESLKNHKVRRVEQKKNCANFSKCSSRTQRKCVECDAYLCVSCFQDSHY
ncbi:piggyBac transposable element-derived protein 3-like [Leptopilina heterotoma]|uniref:piggyBac transposable element-derived protein 3-like n=1 Tax=Leptopilina heterotoma TaxID=63436 RepID=UPI001CA7F3E1|nr:piggyBac transposable element-derived protein 3-like [Leptopilina heterotoma]XP_043472944.1 piggyBac transposable element-derived protein 3-like [Leptopilina heterotoma]XP_043478266.1 piggyBac transposable element-derived protein 3-like [Leptopilina heterotoma]